MDLYFECHSGVSGDMTLGALVALGADLDAVAEALGALPVSGFRLDAECVKQCGVLGTRVRVEVDEAKDVHRTWPEVRDIIRQGHFPQRVERRALAAFLKIAEAEARVHGSDVDRIHFHEVGCLDAIVDVTGAMLALEQLGAERIRCSPVNVGRGVVHCRHGVLPVPAPATAEILKGVPCYQDDLEGELTTPTGAAILSAVVDEFGPMPTFTLDRVGYGAGTREHKRRPNYLRVCAGRFNDGDVSDATGVERRRLRLLVAEMDDETGEVFTDLFDRLFAAGALDVHLIPIQMKKNRPGVSLRVLADPAAAPTLVDLVLDETSTFGVKVMETERYCLARRIERLDTRLGPVDVKVGLRAGRVVKAKPEFDSCLERARAAAVPVREALLAAHEAIAAAYLDHGANKDES